MLYDVAIIGGGINGCGCAADAALRGLSVLLCEQDDLASKTSSSSSKLIHGGLRYLEHYDIAMVKKALDEQQILMNIAPHLVHPLPFVLPHDDHGRPMWLLRTGLFLYDHLSHINTLPDSRSIQRQANTNYFEPLLSTLKDGYLFYDCKTDDARLTLCNALQAKEHGASIRPQTTLIKAHVVDEHWQLTLQTKTDETYNVKAKALINAAGPWIESVSQRLNNPMKHDLSLVKGSHIVVHKLYEGDHAYLLQHHDKRVIFVIPYHGYTMIGTTDVPYQDTLDHIAITPDEIQYLSDLVQHYFNQPIQKSNIIASWSGVRPLLSNGKQDASALSRDYVLHYVNTPAPVMTIYGGKITTYRQLASQAIDSFQAIFPHLKPTSSKNTPLPGATHHQMSFKAYQQHAYEKYHWLDTAVLDHYLSTYGTRTNILLSNCHAPADLGIAFTDILHQAEVDYLIREEWASRVDDILWRRTKLGLSFDPSRYQILADYIDHTVRDTHQALTKGGRHIAINPPTKVDS